MSTVETIFLKEDVFSCCSPIFCRGAILDTVHSFNIFSDSKQFVDKPLNNRSVDQVTLSSQLKFPSRKAANYPMLAFLEGSQRIPVDEPTTYNSKNHGGLSFKKLFTCWFR